VPVYARRLFAGGQAMFKLSLYTSEGFQRRALDRLARESVPVVLADPEELEHLEDLYPLVAAHLGRRYLDVGTIEVDDEPRFRVFVDRARRSVRVDPDLGLPCFA
jgi:hypothetical protein